MRCEADTVHELRSTLHTHTHTVHEQRSTHHTQYTNCAVHFTHSTRTAQYTSHTVHELRSTHHTQYTNCAVYFTHTHSTRTAQYTSHTVHELRSTQHQTREVQGDLKNKRIHRKRNRRCPHYGCDTVTAVQVANCRPLTSETRDQSNASFPASTSPVSISPPVLSTHLSI